MSQDRLEVKPVNYNSNNKRLFRRLAREVTGETFEIPDDNQLLFAYHYDRHNIQTLIGALTYRGASACDADNQSPSYFDGPQYNVLTFLFIKRHFQCRGFGSQLLEVAERRMMAKNRSNLRVQSARKAVTFFEKCGYVSCGLPIECVASGSPLFRTLFNMEKKME